MEKNNIKSILFHSTIFNVTDGTSIHLDGTPIHDKAVDLFRLDPLIGTDNDLQNLLKLLGRKGTL